jgi:hypothetical protein
VNTLKSLLAVLFWPATLGMRARDRFVWPLQIAQWIAVAATTYTVFNFAGGDWHRPLADRYPAAVTILALAGIGLIAWMVELEARISERRVFARNELIRREDERLSLQTPYALQTAERAVLTAAFALTRAQIPTDHPEQGLLVDAVERLRTSIGRGESVHPDTRNAYRAAYGTPPLSRRATVAQLVREHGPISFTDLATKLNDGGPGRPPMPTSSAGLAMLLRDPDNPKRPAPWLVPRQPREPYQHVANIPARV